MGKLHRGRRATVTITCLLTLASCATPDSRPTAVRHQLVAQTLAAQLPEAPLDACAVLTDVDIAAVVGEEPKKPKPAEASIQPPGSEFVGSTCQYSGEGWRLRFSVERGHTEASKKVSRMAFKRWKTVPGVGDEAWWGQSDPAKPGTMSAISGSYALVLNWFVRGGKVGPGSLENSTELMRRALGRL